MRPVVGVVIGARVSVRYVMTLWIRQGGKIPEGTVG